MPRSMRGESVSLTWEARINLNTPQICPFTETTTTSPKTTAKQQQQRHLTKDTHIKQGRHMMGYIPMCVSIQSKLLPKSSPGPALTGQVGRNKPNSPSRMINELTLMQITPMESYSCHRAVNNPNKPGEA